MTNLLNSLFLLNYRNYSLCVVQMLLVHATRSQDLCHLGQAQALSYLDCLPKIHLCAYATYKIITLCRYAQGQLIEVNAHSLFSKWFSESGKLVSRLFAKIQV